jgi:hypothetical protein
MGHSSIKVTFDTYGHLSLTARPIISARPTVNVEISMKAHVELKVQGEAGVRVGLGLGKLIRANSRCKSVADYPRLGRASMRGSTSLTDTTKLSATRIVQTIDIAWLRTDFYSVGCRFESCWDRQRRAF